jgi:hypothetical protein
MSYDKEFLAIFNEHYPFERYILKKPKPIGNLFDDAVLTEIFVPATEIKPIVDNGQLICFTNIPKDEIYLKLQTHGGEIRMGYWDFAEHIRENIRDIIITDFGQYEWECLYVDHEDNEDLLNLLQNQKDIISSRYTLCNIKDTSNSEFIK